MNIARILILCLTFVLSSQLIVADFTLDDCEFAHDTCNTFGVGDPGSSEENTCCLNDDEDIRIRPCRAANSSWKYTLRGIRRCGDEVDIVNGVCGSVIIDECGGDLAEGGCNQIPCTTTNPQ